MGELDQLTVTQLREAAEVLGEWVAGQRHEAQVAAEVLDEDSVLACREQADRVEAVRVVLMAEATRREPPSPQAARGGPNRFRRYAVRQAAARREGTTCRTAA